MNIRKLSYLAALPAALSFLVLAGCSDKSSGSEPTELVGPTWQLAAIVNIKGVETLVTGEVFSADFTTSGDLNGQASCNEYFAVYSLGESGELHIDSLGTTLVYCGEGSLMDQYYAALRAAHSYLLTGGTLTLFFAQQGELKFVATGDD